MDEMVALREAVPDLVATHRARNTTSRPTTGPKTDTKAGATTRPRTDNQTDLGNDYPDNEVTENSPF